MLSFITFLNVVVTQSAAILELFAGENQPLLVGRNSLLILDLGLDIFDSVGGLYLEGNGLTRQSLDENLHGERLFTSKNYFQKEEEIVSC